MTQDPQIGTMATVQVAGKISAQGEFAGRDDQGRAQVRVGSKLVPGSLIPRQIDAACDVLPSM